MFVLKLDMTQTLALSVVVLLVGRFLVNRIGVLSRMCIPAPVVGGLLFATMTLIGHKTGAFSVDMDDSLRSFFMIAFFTTIGFGASWNILKKGGIAVIIFLLLATALVLVQNVVGVSIAKAFGENPVLGLLAGSISMTGGHGTAGAFGPFIEMNHGYYAAGTISVAAATFGLIAGSIIGGPTGRLLIEKKKLKPGVNAKGEVVDVESLHDHDPVSLNSKYLSRAFFQIAIAMGIGSIISMYITKAGLTVPPYIGAMLAAAIMRNVLRDSGEYHIRMQEISGLGDIFLAVFLSQALMGLKLWQLADLAAPLTAILVAQVIIMFLFAYFITFNVMGRDFDAAVLAAGHCGFGMGATPNAIANMNAVTLKYGDSTKAFFVLPLVGGLFIDFTNATIITVMLNFVSG